MAFLIIVAVIVGSIWLYFKLFGAKQLCQACQTKAIGS
jgi:hypothetical protein